MQKEKTKRRGRGYNLLETEWLASVLLFSPFVRVSGMLSIGVNLALKTYTCYRGFVFGLLLFARPSTISLFDSHAEPGPPFLNRRHRDLLIAIHLGRGFLFFDGLQSIRVPASESSEFRDRTQTEKGRLALLSPPAFEPKAAGLGEPRSRSASVYVCRKSAPAPHAAKFRQKATLKGKPEVFQCLDSTLGLEHAPRSLLCFWGRVAL